MEVRLVTERLVLSDVLDDDLPALREVAASNPEPAGPGVPAVGTVEEQPAVAVPDPGSHLLAVRVRPGPTPVIGWVEVREQDPTDGVPWIALLELHRDQQGRGYGREVADALAGWAKRRGAAALRVGVDDGDEVASGFWHDRGYAEVDRRQRRGPDGPVGVTVLELRLHAGSL